MPNPISSVSCVSSVMLMGRETGSLHLLASLLLTGGKGADLVIRGNVVLNNYGYYLCKHRTHNRQYYFCSFVVHIRNINIEVLIFRIRVDWLQ
jgi:hypothetical protein